MAAEQVCIVLNEREPSKEHLAEVLQKTLTSRGIESKRLSADPKLDKILKHRAPKLVILDYIIGDYTTGLDILNSLQKWEEPPQAIFLTDEPSVQVAVEAIKGGAKDYILNDNPEAVTIITSYAQEITQTPHQVSKKILQSPNLNLKALTKNSPQILKCLERAKAFLNGTCPLLVIHGSPGAGRTTWATAIMEERATLGPITTTDWRLYPKKAEQLLGLNLSKQNPNRIGNLHSFIIDGVESDAGELIKIIEMIKNSQDSWSDISRLVVGTSDAQIAKMWASILPAITIELPNLKDREEDLAELSNIFFKDAQNILGLKSESLETTSLSFIQSASWRENLSQLKSVLFETALLTKTMKQSEALKISFENYTESDSISQRTPGVLEAQIVVDRFCGDYRLSAMYLGTSVPNLFSLLNGAGK